jgi:hypothetical protein
MQNCELTFEAHGAVPIKVKVGRSRIWGRSCGDEDGMEAGSGPGTEKRPRHQITPGAPQRSSSRASDVYIKPSFSPIILIPK